MWYGLGWCLAILGRPRIDSVTDLESSSGSTMVGMKDM